MSNQGLDHLEVDYSDIKVMDEDRDWDCVNRLKDLIRGKKNRYAHGASTLHRQVLGTFKAVKEIIDQVFR